MFWECFSRVGTLLCKKQIPLHVATFEFPDSVGTYTQASSNFVYYSPLQPDSMLIIASSSSDGFNPTPGSKFLLDDLLLIYPPTGLSDVYALDFQLYPNPAKTAFSVQLKEATNGTLKLYAITGSLVMEQQLKGTHSQLDVSTLPDGLYYLTLQSESGMLSSRKIEVQH